jgi:hypothetical protein
MSRRAVIYLDALAMLGARIVLVLDAGARWLEGRHPTPGDRP